MLGAMHNEKDSNKVPTSVATHTRTIGIIYPPHNHNLTDILRNSAVDMTTVLDRCLHRLEREQARKKAEDDIEMERLQMAVIDWHDFVVVETIDFADNDVDQDLPAPMTLEEVTRSKMLPTLEREEYVDEVEMEMDDEELQLVEEGIRDANVEEHANVKECGYSRGRGPTNADCEELEEA